jgi:predicted RNase H-like HicB family nuclease
VYRLDGKLTVVLEPSEGWWVARIEEWPGVLTQGKTVPSTLRNLAEAASIMLDDEGLSGRPNEGGAA